MKRIGRYNVTVYNDTAMFSEEFYYYVVIDKFTPTNTYVGKKTFYFSYSQETHLTLFGNCPNTVKSLGKR